MLAAERPSPLPSPSPTPLPSPSPTPLSFPSPTPLPLPLPIPSSPSPSLPPPSSPPPPPPFPPPSLWVFSYLVSWDQSDLVLIWPVCQNILAFLWFSSITLTPSVKEASEWSRYEFKSWFHHFHQTSLQAGHFTSLDRDQCCPLQKRKGWCEDSLEVRTCRTSFNSKTGRPETESGCCPESGVNRKQGMC